MRRDWTFVEDIAKGLVAAIDTPARLRDHQLRARRTAPSR